MSWQKNRKKIGKLELMTLKNKVSELKYGAAKSNFPDKNKALVEDLIGKPLSLNKGSKENNPSKFTRYFL